MICNERKESLHPTLTCLSTMPQGHCGDLWILRVGRPSPNPVCLRAKLALLWAAFPRSHDRQADGEACRNQPGSRNRGGRTVKLLPLAARSLRNRRSSSPWIDDGRSLPGSRRAPTSPPSHRPDARCAGVAPMPVGPLPVAALNWGVWGGLGAVGGVVGLCLP